MELCVRRQVKGHKHGCRGAGGKIMLKLDKSQTLKSVPYQVDVTQPGKANKEKKMATK